MEKPLYTECKFARYFESQYDYDDVVVAKIEKHFEDGRSEVELKLIENYERPYWITKPGFRNHKDKKEWTEIDKTTMYKCKQRDLCRDIQRKLGKQPNPRMRLMEVCRSPYVYGADITTPVLIKNAYDKRVIASGQEQSPFSVAVYDLETDVRRGTGEILTGAYVTDKIAIVWYTHEFKAQQRDLQKSLNKRVSKLLGNRTGVESLDISFVEVEEPLGVAMGILNKAHEEKPDLLAAWNMKFDIEKIIDCLTKAGVPLDDAFSDPAIPKKYRYFEWKPSKSIKETASGKKIPKQPSEQWHVVNAPSSFYCVDAMCLYRLIRVAAGAEPSYALDYILSINDLGGKLDFEDADHLRGAEWHKHMEEYYKEEYIAYNIWDCLSIIQLDKQNRDMFTVLMLLCSHSELARFTSTPRRLADDIHFRCLDHGLVQGTTSDQMVDENDAYVADMTKWIVTLPNNRMHPKTGYKLFPDADGLANIVIHGFDSDAVSAYPKTGISMNISKENSMLETCSFGGVTCPYEYRKITLNMTAPAINAVETCQRVYNAPSLVELEDGL